MVRTFEHTFDPVVNDPVGGLAQLTVAEIEAAGVLEVLQTPGAGLGTWSFLDALLEPTGSGSPFKFLEPLGHAREVKVALSGLFGRFVARAYLRKYLRLSVFTHIRGGTFLIDGRVRARVRKRSRGDLPDWLACDTNYSQLTVAEAKGCHDRSGPEKALCRAWAQANRVDVLVANRQASAKRIAIATRWGAGNGGCDRSIMAVRDPEDKGDDVSDEEMTAVFVGLARLHVSSLLRGLGYQELSQSIRDLSRLRFPGPRRSAEVRARMMLQDTPVWHLAGDHVSLVPEGAIGEFVTRFGVVPTEVTVEDQLTLDRLGFRPRFVGVERDLIDALIDGDLDRIRSVGKRETPDDATGYADGGGAIVVDVGRQPIVR